MLPRWERDSSVQGRRLSLDSEGVTRRGKIKSEGDEEKSGELSSSCLFSNSDTTAGKGNVFAFQEVRWTLSYANIVSCMCARTCQKIKKTGHIHLSQTLHPACVTARWFTFLTERRRLFRKRRRLLCVWASKSACVCQWGTRGRLTWWLALFCSMADSR